MAKGKKAVLVITDPGMPPTVFVVPDEALNEGDIKRLNRLLEYIGSYDFDAEEFQECANLKEVHDAIITQFSLENDEEAPEFDWHPDQKLAVTRAEVKQREFAEQYKMGKIGTTTTGRLSSKDTHLSNPPRTAAKTTNFGDPRRFHSFHSPTGRLPPDVTIIPLNPSLQAKKIEVPKFDFDYAAIEKRLFAAIGKPIMQIYDEYVFEVQDEDLPKAREAMMKFCEEVFSKVKFPLMRVGDYIVFDGGMGRLSSKESNLQELPKKLKTPNGKEIDRTWDACCEGCLGWLHMHDPYEVEQCDECKRFELTPDGHEAARKAHREECGCGWPEFDIQDAAMAWVTDLIEDHVITKDDIKELSDLLCCRDTEFMDNVVPAVYACSRLVEKARSTTNPNRNSLEGLAKLLKETRDGIENETLKLKDFGSPPGAEEENH